MAGNLTGGFQSPIVIFSHQGRSGTVDIETWDQHQVYKYRFLFAYVVMLCYLLVFCLFVCLSVCLFVIIIIIIHELNTYI